MAHWCLMLATPPAIAKTYRSATLYVHFFKCLITKISDQIISFVAEFYYSTPVVVVETCATFQMHAGFSRAVGGCSKPASNDVSSYICYWYFPCVICVIFQFDITLLSYVALSTREILILSISAPGPRCYEYVCAQNDTVSLNCHEHDTGHKVDVPCRVCPNSEVCEGGVSEVICKLFTVK